MKEKDCGGIILPTPELLSEMESLQIHGGFGLRVMADGDDTYKAKYCKCVVYEKSCTEPVIPPTYGLCG